MGAAEKLFQLMAEKKASDLFASVGSPITIKIGGIHVPVNQQLMTPDGMWSFLEEITTPEQIQQFRQSNELNYGYPVPGIGSFRVSVFQQRGTPGLVIRFIPFQIPEFESLGLPKTLRDIINEQRGLLLFVGATGSGKSTTIASLIEARNQSKTGHILTLEDPIEFTFRSKKSIINQREVGFDALDYKVALKNAMRQAPDVIFIGEIRDQETMTAAISYAQSGHLCISTMHANNSYHALGRILSMYPLETRGALLNDLSACLKAIVSQRLLRSKKGARVAACEILLNTKHISGLIEQGDVNNIRDAIEKSLAPGSQTFEQSLYRMVKEDLVHQDDALAASDSPNNLLWLLQNADDNKLNQNKVAPTRTSHQDTAFGQSSSAGPQDENEVVPNQAGQAVYEEFTMDV
ncbi:PilT/PilU family type 4a pilus ATPase [Parvibium lacunae]|uniref:PilT/PilU family type 4a pilus ATPase n=1 Tax=Parvibium lacunae TaxID=1888893 RepID=A0A368L788_9BURK|nr:PilT/PilU family type 4a pilus ATPase [Parvibium lacunae]RCS59558.1 PilT/PilU family type 4a pilus ATPase [Parvibium lacunae]